MTINRDRLVTLLVEKTGMDKNEVDSQLDELASRIMDSARRGKALEVKGFGLFYFDEDNNLTFRPSDQLDAEINFSHAGMEPVEIEPPKTTKSGSPDTGSDTGEDVAEDDETDADDVFGIGKTLAGKAPFDEDGDDNDEDTDLTEPFGKLFQDVPDDDTPAQVPDPEAKPEPKEKIKKAGTAPAKRTASPAVGSRKKASKASDPMNIIIVVILAAVFLFAAYFVFTELLDPPQQQQAEQRQTEVQETPPTTAERDVTEATEPDEPEPENVPAPENEPLPLDDPIDEVTTTDPYGLYGELADTEGNVFTIVVHSLQNRTVADQTADELRADGFRVTVTERDVDGQTFFRVGIGQFPDIAEAQQEATTLPDPYNEQHFIHRIQ